MRVVELAASALLMITLGGCDRHAGRDDGARPERLDGSAPADVPAPSASAISDAAPLPTASAPANGAPSAGEAVMAFSVDLHRFWRSDPARAHETVVLSPLSIASSLAMLHAGARGRTRDEIATVLHLSPTARAADIVALEDRATRGFEIARATRVFVDRGLPLEPSFRSSLAGAFATTSFSGAPEAARADINRWVRARTNDRIMTLLPPGAVDGLTRLVTVDAFFARARWATPFDPRKTRSGTFARLDATTVTLDMMTLEHAQRFTQGERYVAVELSCDDDDHALLIVAPEQGAFDVVDAALGRSELDRIVAGLSPRELRLTMPRFDAALAATGMKAPLIALGAGSLFGASADLGAISKEPLFVADVFHAASFAADERGAKMAAATATVVALPNAIPAVTLDRPFLFWLRSRRTNAIVMMGRYMGPAGG